MSTDQKPAVSATPAYRTERIIASLVMAWVIILTSYMIFQDHALSEASMYFLKILLSLSGAVMLATLPGFLDVNYSLGGLSVRAAGGAAAFVFIYTQSPHLPAMKGTAEPRPAVQQPGPISGLGGSHPGGTPIALAFYLDPASIAAASSAVSIGPVVGAPLESASPIGSFDTQIVLRPVNQLSTGAFSTVSAVTAHAGETLAWLVDKVSTTTDWIGATATAFLEAGAETFRSVASRLIAFVKQVAGEIGGFLAKPDTHLHNLMAAVTTMTDEIANGVARPAVAAVTELTAQLEQGLALGDTVGGLSEQLGKTVSDTVTLTGAVVGGLTTELVELPGRTLEQTGKAVGDLTGTLAAAPKTLLEKTGDLTESLNAQVSTLTDTLNRAAPALVSRIDPAFRDLNAPLSKTFDAASVTSALPDLPEARSLDGIRLPRLGDRFGDALDGRGGEISGCGNCILQPLDVTHAAGIASVNQALSSGLGGVLGGGGSGGGLANALGNGGGGLGAGGGLSGGDGAGSGGGVAGAVSSVAGAGGVGGAVSSAVGGVQSAAGGLTRGLRKR